MSFEEIEPKTRAILKDFFIKYEEASGNQEILKTYLSLISQEIKEPFHFSPYHQKIRSPFDYYTFSLDFVRPLIELEKSTSLGELHWEKIRGLLAKGENVILLANHQTETDPQVMSILLEKKFSDIGEKIIYVAGERVTSDLLAIPFSKGCDLLCIYSKRYIDFPPEKKMEKQLHNKKTMELMSALLQEGGKIIYVAPSGGRDRKDEKGNITPALFDAASIEMFYLMAKRAKTPTHFFPLALASYDLLPPPETIQKELGEARHAKKCPVHMYLEEEFNMDAFEGETKKMIRRTMRRDAIYDIVTKAYQRIT